jgi:hypothetical protein
VRTVAISWQHSWELSAVLAIVGSVLATSASRRMKAVGAFVREAAVIGVLYGLWRLAGEVSLSDGTGAFARARWIERFEHAVHLPSEASVQHLVLGHRLIVQLANLYYGSMHLTLMLVFLVWLFVRHRDQYPPVRTVMAVTTLGCLIVELTPVAPPRMLPGIVDTAMQYHQSVYANGLPIDQLSAMPSLHVGWAVLIGYYTWRVSSSRWRYIGPAHAVITIFVVLVTGNHWWLDGIVAVSILIASSWLVYGIRTAFRAVWSRRRATRPPAVSAAPVADLQKG